MTFDVYKTGPTWQEWWAGAVEAPDETTALELARERFPSRNPADTHAVAERTPERQAEIDRHEAEKAIRAASAPRTYRDRCRDRVVAYHDKCRKNKLAALDANVLVLGGVTPTIERAAERIDADFDATVRRLENE